jgi:hypothetical protein
MNPDRCDSPLSFPEFSQALKRKPLAQKFRDPRKESNQMNILYNSMQNFISQETQRKKVDPMKLINDARSRSTFSKLTRS